MYRFIFLFFIVFSFLDADILETGDLGGITLKELNKKEIVTYNPKTNELKNSYYYIKDGQLFKSEDKIIYPTNKLHSKSYRLFEYKKLLNNIGCKEYKAKDCIKTYIPTKYYFEYDKKRVYVIPKDKSKIYNIIKYNYNKTF